MMTKYVPNSRTPWLVLRGTRKGWIPTCRLHQTRAFARAFAKTFDGPTRVVRPIIPVY